MIKVNLLSPERKDVSGIPAATESMEFGEDQKESKFNSVSAIGAAILTVAVVGYMYYTQSTIMTEKKNLLEEKRAKKAELKDVEDTLQKLEKTKKRLIKKVALISELKTKQQSSVRMMDEVSNSLPEWVWLQKLSFKKNKLNITGKTIHNNLIADFINNLKATNRFSNIEFQASTRQKQSGLDIFNFKMSCMFIAKKKAAKTTAKKKKKKVG